MPTLVPATMYSPTNTQRMYARLAGFMFLVNYAFSVFGVLAPERIKGTGGFAERAQRVLASEHLYRAALTSLTIGWVCIVMLAFALYVTLEPINRRLALLALLFRLGEAFILGATVIWSFVTLGLYTTANSAGLTHEQLQALIAVSASAIDSGYFIAWSFLAPGSILFFYLFYKSGYIPRALGALGVLAFVLMLIGNFVALTFPEHVGLVRIAWIPTGIAEIATALWLAIAGIKQPLRETT